MGSRSFMPQGIVATFAHAVAARTRSAVATRIGGKRKKRRKKKTSTRQKVRKAAKSGKPKPGTKAWMAYIRTKRKKK